MQPRDAADVCHVPNAPVLRKQDGGAGKEAKADDDEDEKDAVGRAYGCQLLHAQTADHHGVDHVQADGDQMADDYGDADRQHLTVKSAVKAGWLNSFVHVMIPLSSA